uniref:Neural proliferation, differentiation and control, 1a n=1 Tax=Periophthalmus magnuspinnatus TaxID=409849 RepID=A0A3B4BMW6_9GOBI
MCCSPEAVLLRCTAALIIHSVNLSVPRCPSRIDCAKAGRHFCRTGSSKCGPCLYALEENDEELCYPDLDEEIDYLHSVIEKQQVSEVRQEQKQSNHFGKQQRILYYYLYKYFCIKAIISNRPVFCLFFQLLSQLTHIPYNSLKCFAKLVILPTNLSKLVKINLNYFCLQPLDHTLAQNAQMFHYQHQKQQMLSMGKQKPEAKAVDTDVTSDEEEVGGDFTVYECPGLAPTGEMEVKNPLFDDSSLPYQGNHK